MRFEKGKTPWNKGIKLSENPKNKNMGFQKGNTNYKNPKVQATQFKKGISASPETQLKKGHIKSEKWYESMRNRTGEKNPAWKGGLEFRKPSEHKHLCSKYKEWMLSVKKRDNWKCKIANEDCHGNLEAHHILGWIDYPELRYELNNGITLCHAHHPRKRAEEKRLVSEFQRLVSVSNEII